MTRVLALSVDQLSRPQPGGIATYVRGLLKGLEELSDEIELVALAPRGGASLVPSTSGTRVATSPWSLSLLTRLWPFLPLGVPRDASIVHATSMAGPFGGGASDAVHSVAMHDLLWRDEPGSATRRGVRFHEGRLAIIRRREDVRVFTTSPSLGERLIDLGVREERVHYVRLGVDDVQDAVCTPGQVRDFLRARGVEGPFTFYAGTREPRKNLARLIDAHQWASEQNSDLGPLVIAGPKGWGTAVVGDAVVLGAVERSMLLGLYREATVVAYVALAEGWGLPPVEALHAGARVVASSQVPSVANNSEAVRVNPLDVEAIGRGLLEAMTLENDETARKARRASVSDLTWRNSVLDHLKGWR